MIYFLLLYFVSFNDGHTAIVYNPVHSSVQSLSRVQLFATPWTAARQASLKKKKKVKFKIPGTKPSGLSKIQTLIKW